MEEMEQWRQDLASLSNNRKKQITEQMGISQSTLSRWWTGANTPQNAQVVQNLARAAPEIAPALRDAFPDAFEVETGHLYIPRENLEEIFQDMALVAESLNQYTITNKVFEWCASQLDPREEGFLILASLCVRPEGDGKVTHLRCADGYGTGLWRLQQVLCPFELGKESLSGAAVSKLRPVLFPHQHKLAVNTPTLEIEQIKSAVAYPLLKRGRVAGGLFFGSVHPDFFTQTRRNLCKSYSYVYASAFLNHRFYAPDRIELQ